MSDKIDKLIEGLPEEFQPIAERYVTFFVDTSFEDLQNWIELVAEGNWQLAYKKVVGKMSHADLGAELDNINARLRALNRQGAEAVQLQKEIIRNALLTAFAMAKANI